MKTFHKIDLTLCPENRNKTFLDSGYRNESNSHWRVPASDMKTFHELDVHYFEKVGIKRFWAQEAEMSLTATSVFQQAR